MKLYEVYAWELYDSPWGHRYFIDPERAKRFQQDMGNEYPRARWEIEEIETED